MTQQALIQAQKQVQSSSPIVGGILQRKCSDCGKKRRLLQRRAVSQAEPEAVPPVVHEVLRSPGAPLDAATREFMEPRFGQDFSQVRVHFDANAANSAREVDALAYTMNNDIFFGSDQYRPSTSAGQWMLAHELTHVIQQREETIDGKKQIELGAPEAFERQADSTADAIMMGRSSHAKAGMNTHHISPTMMLLTPAQFRARLGTTPEQRTAIDTLFANTTFRGLWDYLDNCNATPKQDLGPLVLEVTPGLRIGGAERFGGYSPLTRTLEINPTKREHVSNPSELVDTIVHELIHAEDDLQQACVSAGSPAAPLDGAATVPLRTRASIAGTPEEARLVQELGPSASRPCEEFIDINATAQGMIVQILLENIRVSRVGRPTLTFVNAILRRNPAARTSYESCRRAACARPTENERSRAVARCSAETIGRFMPPDLTPSLLPSHLYFNFGATNLRSDSIEALDLVALFLMANPLKVVRLIGHADPAGDADYNLRLGQQRADTVAQNLLNKGVSRTQIASITSRGELDLLSTGPATHWKDRRVDIIPI